MQSEHATILRMCQRPTAVVEIAAHLQLPVTFVLILLTDLIDTGQVTARHPAPPASPARPLASPDVLEKVLVALHSRRFHFPGHAPAGHGGASPQDRRRRRFR